MIILYFISLIVLLIYSWGFVDANSPFPLIKSLYTLAWQYREVSTLLYATVVSIFFVIYSWILWKVRHQKLKLVSLRNILIFTILCLFFAFPAFSNDIFNYIATAKVAFFYRENPYIVMPIDIPNEPMLLFLQASNKVALYGPFWILLTAIPFSASLGKLFWAIYTFKAFIIIFYLLLIWLIWKLSNKRLWCVVFFAFNPLVLIETFVDAHNDVVMMAFALLAFFFLQKKRYVLSFIVLLFSIFIKYATVVLVPIWIWIVLSQLKGKRVSWDSVWLASAVFLFLPFFLSPLREEMYPWYFIWPLSYISLLPNITLLHFIAWGFSFGLSFRVAPFLLTRDWGGMTPTIKKIITFVPPVITTFVYAIQKRSRR